MHELLAVRLGLCLFCLAMVLLPASYIREVVAALRTGRLDMDARGVRFIIVRTEQPRRFVVTVTALLVTMTLVALVFIALAASALLAT